MVVFHTFFVLKKGKIMIDFKAALSSMLLTNPGKVVYSMEEKYFIDEDIEVIISEDGLNASALLLAPESGGSPISIDAAKRKLHEAGVTHGINEQTLIKLIGAKVYDEPQIIAGATLPIDGEDGKLLFNFSTDERTGSPKEIGSGKVDYRALDLYVPVEKDQLLVTRIPATDGVPGKSVRGEQINQKPGKEIMLPKGKNVVVNDEKTEMHAACSGMVEYVNNSINVSSVYSVKGDCDLSVGDIDFDGSVHISGSVRSGSTVRATGGVIVDGAVEAATIIAGGNVEVKGGMQGGDKGLIEAGGAVTIMYVERGTVQADGPVTLDVSIHSIIESGDTLTAKGRRGAIIGGRAGSSGNIIANYVGALSHTRTEVAVGVMPRKRARLQFLETEMERLSDEQIKLNQLDTYLESSRGKIEHDKWHMLYTSGAENRRINDESLCEVGAEREKLMHELKHATEGMIHVFETVFSGAKVMIGSESYTVNDEINYVSFRHSDSDIVYGPCELSKIS